MHDALGRVTAAPVRAPIPLPPFDNSAMDGYALRLADLAGTGPWRLRVAARVRAGDEPPPLLPGTAARIFTGAPVPEGADCVVMQERVHCSGGAITLDKPPESGANIRLAGEDVAEGATCCPHGFP